jgi:[acyl-carrier-protein] S-malonyltransferase
VSDRVPSGLLFPGQGAQAVGMGKDFADAFEAARRVFDEADRVLGYPLSRLCFEGPADELTLTTHAQPAIFTTSLAVVAVLREKGLLADVRATAGLSLGEYTAVHFAGCLSFADALRLVKRRGTAMQAAADRVKSGMVSLLGADLATAREIADAARGDGVLVVANVNGPGQIVLSGDLEACARVPEAAKAKGVRRSTPLQVAGAFHSPLMEPARIELEAALREVPIRDAAIPVVSNASAAPVTKADDIRLMLSRQLTSPVMWEDSMRALAALGCARFYEPAPGSVLSGLAKRILPEADVRSCPAVTALEAAVS